MVNSEGRLRAEDEGKLLHGTELRRWGELGTLKLQACFSLVVGRKE